MQRFVSQFQALFESQQSQNSGLTLTNGLSASNYIREIITNCVQTLHALRVLRCHGLPGDAVQTVYRATVIAKLLYACCAWSGFITASDRKRVDAFLRRSKRCGFCPPDLPPFNELIEVQDISSSLPLITTHSIYSITSYHHRQLLLKATTSGRELITVRYRTVLDIS